MDEAVSCLPSKVYRNALQLGTTLTLDPDQIPEIGAVKDGGLADRNGNIVVRRGGSFELLRVGESVATRIRGMLQVRDAVREVFRSQLTNGSEAEIVASRLKLNRVYDSFISRFGAFNRKENGKAFADDPDKPLLLSLEDYDPEAKRATKTAIFERATLERYKPVTRVETASEALLVSLNETGRINWARMESLTNRPTTELQTELGSLAYRNPEGGEWETADRYLSGNVRAKLIAATSSAQIDPVYQRNVEALNAVQPKDLEPGEIEARLGSSWIPPSDVRNFTAELLEVSTSNVKIRYAEAIATWTVEPDNSTKFIVSNRTTHGTARFRATDLIEQALNGQHRQRMTRQRMELGQ